MYFSLLYLYAFGYLVSTISLLILAVCCANELIESVKVCFAGRKSLPLHYQNQGASVESLDLKVQHPEMSNNLYPDIEPYNTGYLKVSDIHTLFYEQSGNPSGYVSYPFLFKSI